MGAASAPIDPRSTQIALTRAAVPDRWGPGAEIASQATPARPAAGRSAEPAPTAPATDGEVARAAVGYSRSELPVIPSGFSIPSRSRAVGETSARMPGWRAIP